MNNSITYTKSIIGTTTVIEGDDLSTLLFWIAVIVVFGGIVLFFSSRIDKKNREKAIHVHQHVQQEGLLESLEEAQNYKERKHVVLGIPGLNEYKPIIDEHLISHFYDIPITDVVLDYSIPGNQAHSKRLEYIRSAAKEVWKSVSLFKREDFLIHSQSSIQYIARQGYSFEDSHMIYDEIRRQEYERRRSLSRNKSSHSRNLHRSNSRSRRRI